ncbi:MAG: hypothetical protein E7666_05335 [Ruminococcaceae bacterium]|nr:hypothetical protein [Oscillospiraceae bacterium]
MQFYEYDPKPDKKREKLAVWGLLALSAALFAISQLPRLPYPSLAQLLMVFALVGVVMLVSRCLLRRFIYAVVPSDSNVAGGRDFVITEYYGNHVSVVCRISVSDITEITKLTRENRGEISQKLRRQRVYHYTAQLWGEDFYLLTVRDEDEVFYIRILADANLLNTLKLS